jgi:hypothetical protein
MEVGCVIFGMTPKKSEKICEGQRSWRMEWGGGLAGIQTTIHIERYMGGIYWACDVWAVLTALTVWRRQPEPTNSWFGDHAHQRLRPVQRTWNISLINLFIQSFYFVSYYFLELNMMVFFKKIQETYNSRLRERYGDDPSIHPDFDPDLWMEVGLSGGPDKNWV